MTWDMGHPAGREPGALIRDSVGREPGPLFRAKRGLITKAIVSLYPARRDFLPLHLKIATTKINWRTLERTTKTPGKS